MTDTALISATIRELDRMIERRRLKLYELGEMTGIQPKKIGQMLREHQYMRLDEYVRICTALGVNPSVPLSIATAQITSNERKKPNESNER